EGLKVSLRCIVGILLSFGGVGALWPVTSLLQEVGLDGKKIYMRLLAGIHQTSVGKKLAILFGIISTRLRESKISQRSKDFEKGRGNGMHVNQRRTATSVSSGLSSFTFTSKQFENLMRNVLKDMNPSATISDCTDNELEFVAAMICLNASTNNALFY
ncbi:hypothetical protein Tco_1487897, partial [Tanacetum coccineum]